MGAKLVHHTGRQRAFGADDGQADLVLLRPLAQLHDVGNGNVFQPVVQRRAAVAGGDVDPFHLGRLGQLPGQCVFTATAADDEDFHSSALW